MALPRSCICGGIHQPGERCPRSSAAGTTTQRFGKGWAAMSRAVIERDGGVCQLQLPGCTHVATTADHIVPRSKGGTAAMENLRAACRPCNSRRGNRT
jgi:5-methylcytosine-specific restriction endonuclease McrA